MKLKYYLRGLGVGIICTAVIMGIALSGNEKEKLTDAEIIERARLLGMVMADETEPEKESQEEEKESLEEENQNKEVKQNKENTDDKKDAKEPQEEEKDKDDTQAQAPAEQQQRQPEIKIIEIVSGDYSDVVSQKLFDAGLIADAAAFNAYLTESGADRGITVGVHKIPVGSSEEEIIRILGEKAE